MKEPIFVEKKVTQKAATVVLKGVRARWLNLASPDTRFADKDEHGQPTNGYFNATVLIPKKQGKKFVAALEKTVNALAKQQKVIVNQKDVAKAIKTALTIGGEGALLKDGDNMLKADTGLPYDGNEGMYLFTAKTRGTKNASGKIVTKFPIAFYRADGKSRISEDEILEEFYPGAWVSLQVSISPYLKGTNKGFTVYLNSVQKVADDDQIGGGGYFDDESEEEAAEEEETERDDE